MSLSAATQKLLKDALILVAPSGAGKSTLLKPDIRVGFTSNATYNSKKGGSPGLLMNGICLFDNGKLYGGNGVDDINWSQHYLDENITENAKEVITILTIKTNGAQKEIQFIVDGNEGAVHQCQKKHFENGADEIFPVVSLRQKDQQLEFIPFNQVTSRSLMIDELMKAFSKSLLSFAPSTSSAKNDALISEIRDQISRSQNAFM